MLTPSALTLPEVQRAFRDVDALVSALGQTTPYDWKRRRLINLLDGTGAQDAATVGQLDAAIAALRDELTEDEDAEGPLIDGPIRVGAFAQRGAATAHKSELFVASDRTYVTWVSTGAVWQYLAGMQRGLIAAITTGLTTNDAGYLYYATDFARAYRWTGSAWEDAPGAPARGQIVYFPVTLHADFAPGTGWQLCDGTAGVTRSTPTGGTTTVTVPDLTTDSRFLRSVAGATGGTGGSATTHTHAVNPPNTTSGTPSNTTTVQAGAGATVASDGHTHDTDIASFTSGAPSGSGGDDALPPYYNARPYMRL